MPPVVAVLLVHKLNVCLAVVVPFLVVVVVVIIPTAVVVVRCLILCIAHFVNNFWA